ncbi:MAG: FAD:protein FMN transferase [Bacteroidaceae bacterium]|nr:FAD:protein FMN transferase [Bacteroidaceae bacterium]
MNSQLDRKAEPHRIRWWHILLLIALVAGTVYIIINSSQGEGPSPSKRDTGTFLKCEGAVFGTFYHITYQYPTDLHDSIKDVLHEVDNSLSPFNKSSVITAINNGTSDSTNLMFREVFTLAKTISTETYGAFDITVAPLVNAWGFGFKNKEIVTPSLIATLLTHIGIDKVSLQDNRIIKTDSALILDCSAIAKGYGVDAVGRMLESKQISNYMVEIGGEVRVRGQNPQEKPWSIGIITPTPDPTGQNNEVEEILHITDIAMATSGNYRNFYIEGNKRYAHTIDPRTGYPVQHSILSSTVLARDCAVADAYATAFMVLGLDSAKTVLAAHPELQAYFIYSDADGNNATWHTDNLLK